MMVIYNAVKLPRHVSDKQYDFILRKKQLIFKETSRNKAGSHGSMTE